jgi:hypothetical protein
MTINDPTEDIRIAMIANDQPAKDLEQAKVRWSTEELARDFEVISFLAPFVVVQRKSDGVKGSMEFTHDPRWYFNFVAD